MQVRIFALRSTVARARRTAYTNLRQKTSKPSAWSLTVYLHTAVSWARKWPVPATSRKADSSGLCVVVMSAGNISWFASAHVACVIMAFASSEDLVDTL